MIIIGIGIILIVILLVFILIPKKEEKKVEYPERDFRSLPRDPSSVEVLQSIADLFSNREKKVCKVSFSEDHNSAELIIKMLVIVDGNNVWKSWILRSKDITPYEE